MPSSNNVQILKESKARFEDVIFKQTADLGTNKSTSCKVIDEATGEVIAQSGGGGEESDFTTAEVTVAYTGFRYDSPNLIVAIAHDNQFITGTDGMISENGTYTVVLFKGIANAMILAEAASYTVTVTGDATESEGYIEITGDCTIAIAAAEN